MVIATQNPIEHEGTYPLPEAQLDRFLMKVNIDYPNAEEELAILRREQARLTGLPDNQNSDTETKAVLTAEQLLQARKDVLGIYLDEMLERYIVTLVAATRDPSPWDTELSELLARGASPRATLALARAGRARAYLMGRDFVEPNDILALLPDVLNHRIALSFTARAQGVGYQHVLERIADKVPVP